MQPEVDVKYVDLGSNNYQFGIYKVTEKELNYPIVVTGVDKTKKAGVVLGTDVTIVKNGSIENNGTISSSASETLTVANGLGETLTNGVNGTISSKVIIEGASTLLQDLNVGDKLPAGYEKAAKVTNNGDMMDVQVDGILVLAKGSHVNGAVTASAKTEGEIINTDMGYIKNTVATGVKVVAEYKSLDMRKNVNMSNLKGEMKAYVVNYRVNVIRLTGAVTMDDTNRQLMETEVGDVTLEFAQNSSLTIGIATLKSDLKVIVTGKDVQWNGADDDRSEFNLTNVDKDKYIDGDKVAEGNVVFNNCEEVAGLK